MDEYASLRKIEFELCGGNLPEKYKAFVRRVLNDRNLIPAADVAPVVHGRWEQDADGDWYCTNCGEVVAICDSGRERTYRKPYCPNCGVKMDGKKVVRIC